MGGLDLERELDSLYALPLAQFITARNDLAKRLRAGGDRSAAAAVKGLTKPSVTAWAVNSLYHHERRRFDRLLQAAAAVRAALAGKGDRRQADSARRKALQALLGAAGRILGQAGHAATPANRQRISHTLETLAARDPVDDGPRAGRLAADLEPPGFDVLAGLAASLAPASTAATGSPRRPTKKTAAPSAAATARDARYEAARLKVDELQTALVQLEEDVAQADDDAGEARERYERRIDEAAAAEQSARQAAAAAATAKKKAAAAKAVVTKAKAARRRALARLQTARRQLERHRG